MPGGMFGVTVGAGLLDGAMPTSPGFPTLNWGDPSGPGGATGFGVDPTNPGDPGGYGPGAGVQPDPSYTPTDPGGDGTTYDSSGLPGGGGAAGLIKSLLGGSGGLGGLGTLAALLGPALAGAYGSSQTNKATGQVVQGINNASTTIQNLLGNNSAFSPYVQGGQNAMTKLGGLGFQPTSFGQLGGPNPYPGFANSPTRLTLGSMTKGK